ncbi:MAG: hypothetical protein METHP_01806 [Methanoregula sp. SKADARSKE-2]|nr:MAG: hypothetical protein METHP_01806 [Methanoregula sp. SKADARSKE-2]
MTLGHREYPAPGYRSREVSPSKTFGGQIAGSAEPSSAHLT